MEIKSEDSELKDLKKQMNLVIEQAYSLGVIEGLNRAQLIINRKKK